MQANDSNLYLHWHMQLPPQRKEVIERIAAESFDIIVIGGGITGAGIALDAASRGMRVLLAEKYDIAGGTSSKSTKLIHGGLRYLKQLEFSLVRQTGRERALIYKLAPHLVKPVDMLLPVYKKGSLSRNATSLALWVYDLLAKVKKEDAYKMLGKEKMKQLEPMLRSDGLIGGAIYREYRTDDARLTMAILKIAVERGALCINYMKVEGFELEDKKISGVKLRDLTNNKMLTARSAYTINAAGPWVDEVRSLQEKIRGKQLHITKGVHLVVEGKRFPVARAVYFDVPQDKRMIFVIPRDEIVYIGTTDTNYIADKDNIDIRKEDVLYLIEAVNAMFPKVQLQLQDIRSAWAGLRPLIHQEGKKPSALSRKDEIFISEHGLISIAGGKLTGYRKMAEKTADIISALMKKQHNKKFPATSTAQISLQGANFDIPIGEYIERRIGEAAQIGITAGQVAYLVNTYGTDCEIIIDNAFSLYAEIKDAEKRILYAELQYAVQFEMVMNISDFLIRRTGMLYFDKARADKICTDVAEILGMICGYSEQEMDEQIRFYREASDNTLRFIRQT